MYVETVEWVQALAAAHPPIADAFVAARDARREAAARQLPSLAWTANLALAYLYRVIEAMQGHAMDDWERAVLGDLMLIPVTTRRDGQEVRGSVAPSDRPSSNAPSYHPGGAPVVVLLKCSTAGGDPATAGPPCGAM